MIYLQNTFKIILTIRLINPSFKTNLNYLYYWIFYNIWCAGNFITYKIRNHWIKIGYHMYTTQSCKPFSPSWCMLWLDMTRHRKCIKHNQFANNSLHMHKLTSNDIRFWRNYLSISVLHDFFKFWPRVWKRNKFTPPYFGLFMLWWK